MPVAKPPAPPQTYLWSRTFFQHNKWSALDCVGELIGRGITQVAIVQDGADWIVSWPERTPPDVIATAEDTPA